VDFAFTTGANGHASWCQANRRGLKPSPEPGKRAWAADQRPASARWASTGSILAVLPNFNADPPFGQGTFQPTPGGWTLASTIGHAPYPIMPAQRKLEGHLGGHKVAPVQRFFQV
jgi:hypothetical protein